MWSDLPAELRVAVCLSGASSRQRDLYCRRASLGCEINGSLKPSSGGTRRRRERFGSCPRVRL